MGVVYEAEQVSLGRRVALKVLPRQVSSDLKTMARFRREARSAAQLHHTNIVPVFEVGKEGEVSYYAMQFIQGQGLDTVIDELWRLKERAHPSGPNQGSDRPGPPIPAGPTAAAPSQSRPVSRMAHSLLTGRFVPETPEGPGEGEAAGADREATAALSDRRDPDEIGAPPSGENSPAAGSSRPSSVVLPGGSPLSAVESRRRPFFRSAAHIGRQVAAGLAYAHARGIVHRDIKPSNLLLDTQGVVWITDFGLAKASDDRLTQTGDILGTIRYMAPERFRGQGDARADIYALGLTLYELLTLRPAFDSPDRLRLIEQIKTAAPPRPRLLDSRIPRDLETIVMKAIEKDPQGRYPSADALAEDLRRFVHGEPIRARPVGRLERLWRWSRRKPALAAALATTTTLLLLVAIGGPAAAVRQAPLRRLAPSPEAEARTPTRRALAARKAEAERRREAEAAQYQASAQALGAIQALADADLNQARVLRYVGQPGRQTSALRLLGAAARSQAAADALIAGLRADPDRLGPTNGAFWGDRLPALRDEAGYWLGELSVLPLPPVRFPRPSRRVPPEQDFLMMPNLQDRLALSPDGTLAAYVRSTARESPPARFDELVLIATVNGKVLRRVALSADRSDRSFEGQGLVTPRFRADGSTVLIARIDRSGQMPTAEIEQRTIETGERVKTVPLEPPPPPPGTRVPADVPPLYSLPTLQRLTFSPDGRLLLGIEIPYSGVRAGDSGRPFRTLVWNVADGALLGHHAVVQTQGFGASGELIGYNGRDLEFRDPVTGKLVRTLAPPPDLKTVPELQAQAGRILGFSPTRLRPSIWASPDARWLLMLVVKGNYGGLYDADMLVALDARTGREAGRLEFPLTRGMGRIPFGRLLSLAACDREGRWVALLTPSDVRILTMPGLEVLSTQPFDLEAEQQARQSGRPIPVFRLPIGLVADDAGASLYGVTYPLNAAQPFAAPDPGTTPPRLDETVFGFDLALPAGSPLRALAGGAVTGVAFDPRA